MPETYSLRKRLPNISLDSNIDILIEGHIERIEGGCTKSHGFFPLSSPDIPIFSVSQFMAEQEDLKNKDKCALVEYEDTSRKRRLYLVKLP